MQPGTCIVLGMFPLRQVVLCLCGWVLLGTALAAQEPSGGAAPALPPPTPPPANQGPVQLLEPDTFLLPDKNGNLQTVLRFPFEEFIEAVKLRNQIVGPENQPRYNLESLLVTGKAEGDFARLQIELTVLVRTHGWVRVPLGLSQVVLRKPAHHNGAGQHFLHFDAQHGGYVSWLQSEPGATHRIVLDAVVPLTKLGGETALQLGAPRATTSRFQIDVAMPKAVGRLVDGAQPLTTEYQQKITRFSGLGLGGEFELAWRGGDRPAAKVPTALEANGVILVRIDGRSVRSEARLTVRSFGGEFDQFRVRLPPGAELVAGSQPGYTLAPVEQSRPADGDDRLVDVKLDRKTVGPVEVRLVTEQSRELAGADRSVELAGFEVLGAIRQWGHLAVEVIGDWQVLWGTKRNLRQVEDLPESLRRADLVAGFEYFSQPCSLPARVTPRTTRVRVEPEFLLFVGARQAELEARLKYSIRGAKAFQFDIKMPGWELETVNPANVFDVDAIDTSAQGVISVKLLQPTTGQVELVLRARRELKPEAREVALPLPVPEASSQTPSTVVVLPEDNVELTPLPEKIAGLTPMQIAPRVKLPARQQTPLYYRGEGDPSLFAAALEIHAQRITASAASVVRLEQEGGRVDQTLSYRVQYEPVDKLTLAVPTTLKQFEQLQVLYEKQPLVPVVLSSDETQEGAAPTTLVRVTLPQAKIGNCELQVSYPLTTPEILPQQSVALPVPLVMPAEGELEKNEVLVQPGAGISVSHRKGTWTATQLDRTAAAQHDLRLRAEEPSPELPLAVQLEERLSPGATVVYRAWLQTWLTNSRRQDRICYQLSSNEEQITLKLPEGIESGAIEVLLDKVQVPAEINSDGLLSVPLPPHGDARLRHLELRYIFLRRETGVGKLALELPQLEGSILREYLSWQLVLPRHEHVVAAGVDLIPEFRWGWGDFYWGRYPLRSQAQLESWIGATAGAQPPPGATNEYLFQVRHVPDQLHVRTATRATVVLLCSGVVLLLGLILLYVPASREPGVILALSVVLLAVGLLYPEPALLAAQAAVLGVVLVVISALLKRLAARPKQEVLAPSVSSLITPQRAASDGAATAVLPPAPSSATTTVALHSSEGDA